MQERILLILDLDETLVHASETPLEHPPDLILEPYFVYKRPGLDTFLTQCGQVFDLAIWSSGLELYVSKVATMILPHAVELKFLWSRQRCTYRRDQDTWLEYFAKDLRKVRRLGHRLERILIVDDEPIKLRRNYGNAIYIKPFVGDPQDIELNLLMIYLRTLKECKDLRAIEKRRWRENTINSAL